MCGQDHDERDGDSFGMLLSLRAPPHVKSALLRMQRGADLQLRASASGFKVHFVHSVALKFDCPPAYEYCVGRTMWETDGLPRDWVANCNMVCTGGGFAY